MIRKISLAIILLSFLFVENQKVFADIDIGNNLKLYGDLRFRLDYDYRDPGTGTDNKMDSRERPRLKARLGIKHQTSDNISMGLRLGTNSSNSNNSPHQSFDSTKNNSINLDRAYGKIIFFKNLATLTFGKQGYSFWQQTEQFWDEDIQPEGLSLEYATKIGKRGKLKIEVGDYYLKNNDWQDGFFKNDMITIYQLHYKGTYTPLNANLAFTSGRVTDDDMTGYLRLTNANLGKKYLENAPTFSMASLQLKSKTLPIELTFGVDYHFSNADIVGEENDQQNGTVIQLRFKKNKLGFRYYNYNIEETSVLFYGNAVYSQDNFPNSNNSSNAPTGFEGHRIQIEYKYSNNIDIDLRAYLMKAKDNKLSGEYSEPKERKNNRYQFNLNIKF